MCFIEILILVYMMVIFLFIYSGLLESIQDLDTSIRENTIAMTAHIDSMLEGVDDESGDAGLVVD